MLQAVAAAFDTRRAELEADRDARVLVEEAVDVTVLPSRPVGARHPLTTVAERVADVFVAMGWEVAEGPEVEHAWFNFDALNMPGHHPAREEQDTLWLEPTGSGLLLRTQTSPVQIRTLLDRERAGVRRGAGPGLPQRAADATHSPVFGQVEGLCVDEGITMAHLRGTLDAFAAAMFGEGTTHAPAPVVLPLHRAVRRARPAVLRVPRRRRRCSRAASAPARAGSRSAGAAWSTPRVLRACGVDPDRYTGFAFGMGLDRTLMFRHGITDIRDLYEGDQRFSLALGTEA